jgi:hypothetical protein
MKLDRFLTLFFLIGIGLISPSLVDAETPPATTFQPGPWQPIARVDIKRPVQIKILNNADIDIDYDLTANIDSSPQRIQPGKSTMLQDFRIPVYLLINRADPPSDRSPFRLLYAVEVNADNLVTITVTRASEGAPGYTTFNLNQLGAIYIY